MRSMPRTSYDAQRRSSSSLGCRGSPRSSGPLAARFGKQPRVVRCHRWMRSHRRLDCLDCGFYKGRALIDHVLPVGDLPRAGIDIPRQTRAQSLSTYRQSRRLGANRMLHKSQAASVAYLAYPLIHRGKSKCVLNAASSKWSQAKWLAIRFQRPDNPAPLLPIEYASRFSSTVFWSGFGVARAYEQLELKAQPRLSRSMSAVRGIESLACNSMGASRHHVHAAQAHRADNAAIPQDQHIVLGSNDSHLILGARQPFTSGLRRPFTAFLAWCVAR